ncbi:MAG: phosphatase PAP2 family protein [Ardenticatenaceae bacterium]|nr:phosphatase PAP2 family protein [Ardenticatenaceae bacterium]
MNLGNLWDFIWSNIRTYRYLIVWLLLLTILLLSFLWARGDEIDHLIFVYVNSHLPYNERTDWLMHVIGQFGTLWMGLVGMAVAFLLGYRDLAALGAGGMILLWGLVRTIKSVTGRARPHIAVEGARLVGTVPTGLSFPSGHAAQSFFTAYYIVHAWRLGPERWVLFAVAALISYTRIYVGAHYPRDVVAGALMGLVYGYLFVRIFPQLPFALWLAR